MKPIKFKEINSKYIANGCGDLPTYKNDEQIISCWKATPFERVIFLITGKMWFGVIGKQQPPIWLDVKNPFEK